MGWKVEVWGFLAASFTGWDSAVVEASKGWIMLGCDLWRHCCPQAVGCLMLQQAGPCASG